ncbi:MAG: serine hydrolase [Bacteroidales bacterium]|nr:serine hydrolase [Bacteroidales bacterium]
MKRITILSRLAAFLLALLAVAPQVRAQKLTEKEIEETILGYMDDCRTRGMSVALVMGDEIIYQKAFGWRDFEAGDPLDINDLFKIASISKSFSAVSIMQLVDQGKLSLDDDVSDLIGFTVRHPLWPEIPITLRMMMSHTSGMKDGNGNSSYWTPDWVDPAITPRDSMIKYAWYDYAPGQGYNYCNRGFNMLGRIIERATGERFDDYVRHHVLDRVGIGMAGYNVDSLDASRLVAKYSYNKAKDTLIRTQPYVRVNEKKVADGTYVIGKDGNYWSPTGGMKISAPDLAKWMMCLRDSCITASGDRLISAESYKRLFTPITPADPGTLYCQGLRTETRFIEGKTLRGHTGSLHGLKSCMFFCPGEDWGFVCLCSSTKTDKINQIYKIYYETINLLYEQKIKPIMDENLHEELADIMKRHEVISMTAAVVRGDKVVYSDALGLKSRETGEPASVTDIYRIASISKTFSGASIMQLVEQGKVGLDNDVSDILGYRIRNPKFPDVPITVRMLLSHTSSVVDNPKVDYKRSLCGTIIPGTADPDTIACCYSDYEPGTHYEYSNRGINLVGAVIERLSGERFDNYVRQHLLLPLGITDAGFNVDSLDHSRFATLYKKEGKFVAQPGAYRRYPEYDTYRLGIDTPVLSPAGGMKISILGLAEWMTTLKNGGTGTNGVQVLTPESVETMFKKAVPDGVKGSFGAGYGLTASTNPQLLGFPMRGHGGSAYGLRSCLYFSPEKDFGMVFFCSSTDGASGPYGGAVAAYCEAAEALYRAYIANKLD